MNKNLKAFLYIAQYENLTVAADKIGLTQSSLTKRLSNLEDELGCKLFKRHRRGMSLTTAGISFNKRAIRIEQEMLQAKEELRSLKKSGLDILRVGAGPLFHQRFVAPVFSKLLAEYPSIILDLTVDTNERSLPLLMKGKLDIVLGVIQPLEPNCNLLSKSMTTLEQGLIITEDYECDGIKFVKQDQILPEHLKNLKWILYGEDKNTEAWLNDYFQQHQMGLPHIVVRTASFATGLDLVRESGLVMMAPMQLASTIEKAGLRMLTANPTISKLTSGAYLRPSSLHFPVVKRFLDLLSEEFETTSN